ncbi:hypothetical protein [Streptomyces sp. MP131-18]|uniref:hypothetical protein n=1 Tax=Streptomyces sp. MP131-18 TaxID=1857892 RepID=UPI00097C4EC4|nr:hypothetical protein [Streptomyces sp. MP131-18]ONK13158.1 hypothetical protein STBA_39200 [Streptomyces sp. MP131-18]
MALIASAHHHLTKGGTVDDDFMTLMPPAMRERTGRMVGMVLRTVIAYLDGEAATLAALITRIGTWDDDPGREPYPLPRYQFATQQVVSIVNDFLISKEKATGREVPNEDVAAGAIPLIERCTPAEYRDAALTILREVPPGTAPMDLLRGDGDPGPVELCAAAAAAAWLATSSGVPQTARLHLVRRVHDAEGVATGAPTAERILDISDDDALALLARLYADSDPGDSFARLIPRSPGQRGPWEWDILSALKAHLMETPAAATTPEQAAALRTLIDDILLAAGGVRRQTAPPKAKAKGSGKRTQPKRKPRRKR